MDNEFTKHHFLEAFTSGSTLKHDVTGVSCIDMQERDNEGASSAIDVPEQSLALSHEKAELDEIMASSTSCDGHGQMCSDEFDDGTLTIKDTETVGGSSVPTPPMSNKHFLDLPSDEMAVDVISEDEKRSWCSASGSQSFSASYTAEDEGCSEYAQLENCYAAIGDTLDNEMAVAIFPDYVIHGSVLYGESKFVFSADCIKIECSDASGDDEKFTSEWAVADIVHIDCQWSGSVTTASVKIFLSANDATRSEKHHNDSDVLKVMFSVNDMRWLEKEQKIRNLAVRYKDIWNADSSDMVWEDDTCPNAFFSREYFTEIADSFEDVVYPKGDPDAVSISKRDIDLLLPETFINDTIIDFYIKYLKNKIQPDQKHRYHFFNSFFFRKLADLDKDWGSVSEGRAAFLRVRKWTRKVNIFEKDYIFIPVNFSLHWSLLVICHPGEVTKLKDNEFDSNKVPCILHMDSIKGSHSGLKNIIQSYIWEEWKERHPETTEDSSKFLNLRFVPLELPQQENSFDCGLFLLQYAELFLEEAPVNFNPFKITKLSSFLSAVWFPPAEASLKRSLIRKLIYELLNDPSLKKVNPSTCSNGHPSMSGHPENNIEQEQHAEMLSAHCGHAKGVIGDAVCLDTEDGTEIELLTSSSGTQCDKQAELMPPEFLQLPTNTMPLSGHGDHVHQHNATSSKLLFASCPIMEHADGRELLSLLSLEKENCGPLDGNLTAQFCTTSSLKAVDTYEMPWSISDGNDANINLTVECMNLNSTTVNQRGEAENLLLDLPDTSGYVQESPTSSSRERTDDFVGDSQDADTTQADGRDCEDPQRATEPDDSQNVDGGEINTNAYEVCDVSVRQVPGATAEDGDDVCQEIDTNEAGSKDGEDCQATSSKAVRQDGESHDEIHSIGESHDEIHSMMVDNENYQENQPSSSQGIIITDEEPSLDKDDIEVMCKRLAKQPHKRRRVMIPEGTRMRTRSFTRESHNDT